VRRPRSRRRIRRSASCCCPSTWRPRTRSTSSPAAGFGYLLKDRVLDVADFLAAVDRVARVGSALDPYVVGQLMHRTDGRHGLQDLTEREHDVLRMMAQGYTNAGVARRLFLSERTVEAHVRRLLAKLDIADTEDDHRRVLAVLTYLRTA